MIEVAVYSPDGKETDRIEVDEAWFGGTVHMEALRLAVRRYENRQRVGTAATKSRGMIRGSTRKIFRQKHTGRARMGTVRSPVRRGGGVAFAKKPRDFSIGMPKKMRRRALDSALLARLKDGEVLVLDGLAPTEPKTRLVAQTLAALGVDRTCVLAIQPGDVVLYKSARNLARVRVRRAVDLNAYEVLWPHRLVFTRPAFEALVEARKA